MKIPIHSGGEKNKMHYNAEFCPECRILLTPAGLLWTETYLISTFSFWNKESVEGINNTLIFILWVPLFRNRSRSSGQLGTKGERGCINHEVTENSDVQTVLKRQ